MDGVSESFNANLPFVPSSKVSFLIIFTSEVVHWCFLIASSFWAVNIVKTEL